MPSITIKRLDLGRTSANIELSAAEEKMAEEKTLTKMSKHLKIPGFRPGKVPLHLAKEHIKSDVLRQEMANEVLPSLLESVVREHDLHPVIPPKVQIVSQQPLALSALFVERPETTVDARSIIMDERKPCIVEQDEIDDFVTQLVWMDRKEEEVEREVRKNDGVKLMLKAEDSEKKPVHIFQQPNYHCIAGKGQILPEIDTVILGMKKGEEKNITIVLPKEYPTEKLRQKKISVSITVLAVIDITVPEITAEYLREKKYGETTPEQLRENIAMMMKERKEQEENAKREENFFEQIQRATRIKLAPELVENERAYLMKNVFQRLKNQKMTMEEWLNQTKKTEESFSTEMQEEAQKRLTIRFGLEQLIREKNIKVEEEEVRKEWEKTQRETHNQPTGEKQDTDESQPEYIRSKLTVQKLMKEYQV